MELAHQVHLEKRRALRRSLKKVTKTIRTVPMPTIDQFRQAER